MGPEKTNEGKQQPDVETQAGRKTDEEKMGRSRGVKKGTARENHGRESHQSPPDVGPD